MKKWVYIPVLATTLACSSAWSEVIVYGKANVSLQNADESGDREIELQSNSSRIGLMGEEALSDSVTVLYRFEYETSVDDGDKDGQTVTQRNIYLGLQTAVGTLMGGVFDSPLKTAATKVDLFNDLEGDVRNIFAGENRPKNIVQYVTPKSFGPFTGKVAYITKEQDGIDGVSSSAAYDGDRFYFALAMDQDVEDNAENTDVYRVVSAYQLGPVQLGGAYEKYERDVGEGDGYFGSAQWKLDSHWVLKAQYGESDIKIDGRETLSVGGDYVFSKSTKAFVYYTDNTDDEGRNDNYLGIGLELKF